MKLLIESETTAVNLSAPPTEPAVISVTKVSVEYHAPRERIRSLKEYGIRLLQGRVQHEEFKALQEVSLEIRAGEVFGIIGQNGAGKSTLLKAISRVLRPTSGRVWVKGKVAPLLELGAGFHPELSGRENVFLNGTLLGYTHAEMAGLFDGIVDFAELWEFIDAPLRTYSTGMAMRLGFAVATAVCPDILLVDEALSVGDLGFQQKCAERMREFRQRGTTIVLVTHDTHLALRMCDRAAWLAHGKLAALGPVDEVVSAYQEGLLRAQAQARHTQPALSPAKASAISASPLQTRAQPAEPSPLEELALQKTWFYPFELPCGQITPCLFPPEIAQIHFTRWQMLEEMLQTLCAGDWSQLSALDIGCNHGFYSIKLAQRGCRQVLGIDLRPENIFEAELLHRIYDLSKLEFNTHDLYRIEPRDFEKYDVVLLFGLLYQLENPLGALRLAKALARRVVVIETQLVPELEGEIEWGSQTSFKQLQGAFGVIDIAAEAMMFFGGLTDLSLCPSRNALLWLLKRLGFKRVEVLPPPAVAYEQLATGKRAMIAAYV
jgi:ABC-type polysaccharide/polyol phosphate transport system ATPase subunit/SAM-dependent methyltransferase